MNMVRTLFTLTYGLFAETVAVIGVIEIGPNLLSAVTSIVGVVVIYLQARTVREAREAAEKAIGAKQEAAKAKREAHKVEQRVSDLENTTEN